MQHVDLIDGSAVPVHVGGAEDGRTVAIFDTAPGGVSPYHAVCERLHIAKLRTVLIPAGRLTVKSAAWVLDALRVTGAVLAGDGVGAQLAWDLAATYHERFAGLVVIDCGHPRVADVNGVVRDEHCPHVHVDTTILVTGRPADAVARASRRYVLGDYRLTDLAGWRGSEHFTTQLTTEILLRRHSWPG